VVVALHVATGAAAGTANGSRVAALPPGPILHLAGDPLPRQDIRSRRFEIGSHGRRGWHRSGRFPADLQLPLAGV
jgi:hypothetical protein